MELNFVLFLIMSSVVDMVMTNGHATSLMLGKSRDHQLNSGITGPDLRSGPRSVPSNEMIHEKLPSAASSSMSVKFTREPDLRIYDSENRAQETFFNPVILSQVPLTDQEIEEQERQVQLLMRQKERQQQSNSAAAAKDGNATSGHIKSRRTPIPSYAPSAPGNHQKQHQNPEISKKRKKEEEEEDEERRRRSNPNGNNRHEAVGMSRGSTSLHPIVMHDSPKSMLPHQVHNSSPAAQSHAVYGAAAAAAGSSDPHGIPASGAAVLLHSNTNGIRNHRLTHEGKHQVHSQHLQQQQQNQNHASSSISTIQSKGRQEIGGGGGDDLSQQSMHPSIKMIAPPAGASASPTASGSPHEHDDDYSDAEFEEKRKRAEAGETMDFDSVTSSGNNSSRNPSSLPYEPVPSLEESEPEIQQRGLYDVAIGSVDDDGGSNSANAGSAQQNSPPQPESPSSSIIPKSRPHYGSGNFRRAAHYYRPTFLTRASIRNVKEDRLRKSTWHREPAPEFCNESILIHDECDANINSVNSHTQQHRKRDKRWSFNLEDGNCYQYEDPCPLFKRNSFRQLSQCLATCWRQPSILVK